MAKKDLQQLLIIKERMIAAGIPEDEVNALVDPLKNELQRRICGLVWEHTTTSIPDMEGKIPALTPVTSKNIVNDINGDNHILIEGENLLALMAMQYTHIDENSKGMIGVIYIDPPYNTGSVSFAYNDKFEKSEWLSMMDIRLKLARNLLRDDGVIFVQIDEKYQAELKLLLNDVFGVQNHINTIAVNMSNMSGPKVTYAIHGKCFPKIKEYVFLYSKNATAYTLSIPRNHKETWDREYNLIIPEFTKEMMDVVYVQQQVLSDETLSHLSLESLVSYMRKQGIDENDDAWKMKNAYRIFASKPNASLLNSAKKMTFSSAVSFVTNKTGMSKFIKTNFNRETATARIELANAEINSASYLGDQWTDIATTGGIAQEGNVKFTNGKKPLKLLKRILSTIPNKDAIVLDFFAGSGTTGHAVLDLNKEDGGHRQFILCTNNDIPPIEQAYLITRYFDPEHTPFGSANSNSCKTMVDRKVRLLKLPDDWYRSDICQERGICQAITYKRMQNVFPDYPGNNLYYYRVDQNIAESAIDDVTIANMASRAVFYVAMKENVYNAEHHDDYYLLYNDETDIAVVIDPDMDMFDVEDEIVPTAFSRQCRKVYCSVYEPCMRNGIEYIPYPKEVMDVLKAAKNDIRREME